MRFSITAGRSSSSQQRSRSDGQFLVRETPPHVLVRTFHVPLSVEPVSGEFCGKKKLDVVPRAADRLTPTRTIYLQVHCNALESSRNVAARLVQRALTQSLYVIR